MRAYRILLPAVAAAAILTLALAPARAQMARPTPIATPAPVAPAPNVPKAPLVMHGNVVIPSSSLPQQGDVPGKKAYTNIRFLMPNGGMPDISYPPYSGYLVETPESIACRYRVVGAVAGCNPNVAVIVPSGGSQTIAIVDAYDDPSAYGDLAYFSDQMGLPFKTSQFQIVYAAGYQPPVDYTGGWELEESLDIEYSHAMAPNAMIYLVEAASNYDTDLYPAVQVAVNLVQCGQTTACTGTPTGKGEVSMSWGESEYLAETSADSYFTGTNVVFLASSGDSPGTEYPSASPNVIAVGGTSISRNLTTGNIQTEVAWQDGGGGASLYESKPSYQSSLTGATRQVPDVAADANPASGVWVADSFPYEGFYYSSPWWIVGGTSVAAPTWAGILNNASTVNGSFAASTSAELTKLYATMAGSSYASDFFDINYGTCGVYDTYGAVTKYDNCTGIGAPLGFGGK